MTARLARPYAIVAVLLICAASATLITLIMSEALSKDAGMPVALFLGALMASWIGFELFLNRDRRYRSYLSLLLSPAGLARFGLVMIGGPLAISQALPLFEPGPLTSGDIEQAVDRSLRKQAASDVSDARILHKISGLWGEPGCKVAYRFRLAGQTGLAIDWERRPPGEKPWHAEATILTAKGDILESRGEVPADQKGQAATFRYETNGMTERLIWDYQSGDAALELDRCGK